jgi:hypothetical protein
VAQAVAHGAEASDGFVELLRFCRQECAVDLQAPVRREHLGDLAEREAGDAPHRDQGQPLQHVGMKQPPQALPADRGDQPLFLVVPQGGGRNAGSARHLGDVQCAHALDLKST